MFSGPECILLANNNTIMRILLAYTVSLPEPRIKKFSSLMDDITTGRLKIPQFQRDFVWSMSKSAKLLDSIVKGYPVGTFITWHTNERLRSIRNIGNLVLPEPDKNDFVDLVLDGQQRITSLFAALKGEIVRRGDGREECFSNIVVDLDAEKNEQVVVTADGKDSQHTTIPLKMLLNGGISVLSKFDKQYYKKLEDYKEKIHSYNYSVIQVSNAPIDIAAEIFTRTNEGGTRLSTFEIMVAKTFDYDKNFDLAEKFDELIEQLEDVDYETLPDAAVLQIISLVLAKECRRRVILSLPKDQIIDIWDNVADAVKYAVDYLRDYYRIPVSNLLPYKALVVPLAYFFYMRKDKPDANQQKYLNDFFWRVSLSGRYSSAVESKLAQDVKRIDTILNGKLPEYDWSIDSSADFIKRNGWFAAGRSYVKAILCIYAYYEPKSFDDGARVNISNSWLKQTNSKNYHHFFPKAYLKNIGVSYKEVNNVLNITIVDDYLNKRKIKERPPSEYMAEFKRDNQQLSKTMKTHLIEDLDKFGVWSDDYQKFLDMRANALSNAIRERIIEQGSDQHQPNLTNDDSEELEIE